MTAGLDSLAISYALRFGEEGLEDLHNAGITHEYIDQAFKNAWGYIERVHREKGRIPSKKTFRVRYEDVDLVKVKRDELEDIVRDLTNRYLYKVYLETATDGADHLDRNGFDAAPDVIADTITKYQRLLGDASATNGLVLHTASEVEPKRVEWLWDHRIPLGGVTVLAGRPGVFKTCIAVWLAAKTSSGDLEGNLHDPGRVLFISTEDAWDSTLVPRLLAAEADLDLVGWVERPSGDDLSLPGDLHPLEQNILAHDVRLVVLDPLIGVADGLKDDASNLGVRRLLKHLRGVAERTGAAILAIHHPNKNRGGRGLTRLAGSLAFGAAPRAVYVCGTASDANDDDPMVLAAEKFNIGPTPVPLAYRGRVIAVADDIETVTVEWDGPTDAVTAADLYDSPDPEERSATDEAVRALKKILRKGPVPVDEIQKETTKDLALGWRTVQRAKKKMGIVAKRKGGIGKDGYWVWKLPKSSTAKGDPKSGALSGLREQPGNSSSSKSAKGAKASRSRSRTRKGGVRGKE